MVFDELKQHSLFSQSQSSSNTGIKFIVFYFHVKLKKIENDMKVRRTFSMSHIMCELVMKSTISS